MAQRCRRYHFQLSRDIHVRRRYSGPFIRRTAFVAAPARHRRTQRADALRSKVYRFEKQNQLEQIFESLYSTYNISENAEITLEANPDDLIGSKIRELSNSRINRLSIGIQSFFEEDLKLMNRAHNASEALNCIKEAKKYFNNISIDLIY